MSTPPPIEPAAPFSPRLIVILAAAAAVAVGGLVVLSTFRDRLGGGLADNGEANALSRSAIGYAGLLELLDDSGRRAVISRDPKAIIDQGEESAGLAVFAPQLDEDAQKPITDIVFHGPRLVLIPKWLTVDHRGHANWVDKSRLYQPLELGETLGSVAPGARLRVTPGLTRHRLIGAPSGELAGFSVETGPIDSWRSFEPGAGMRPILQDENGGVVLGAEGAGVPYLVLSDPDLLANHGLKDGQGASAALALIDALDPARRPVAFDVTLNGFSAAQRGVAQALLSPPLLPATLCLVLAGLAMAAHAFGRFGPIKSAARVFGFGKRALADNTAALIRLARRETSAAAPYVALTRELALEAAGAPREMAEGEADAFLDRLGAARGLSSGWSSLKTQALAAANADDLLRVAQDLHRWRVEMTREHR